MKRKELGYFGEEQASAYLECKQFIILERNYYTRFGEIDIIAKKKINTSWEYVFFEVKTRRGNEEANIFDNINQKKLKNFRKTCEYYCLINGILDEGIRMDLIGVLVDNIHTVKIIHEENIWGW